MPFNSIIQCDLCPAVTDTARKFYTVKLSTAAPWSDEDYRELNADAILCPKCAEPILAFQRSLLVNNDEATIKAKRERTIRLNERILAALKKTE